MSNEVISYQIAKFRFRSFDKHFSNVPMNVRIVWFLCADIIAETDGGEANESEVQRIEIIPAFQRCVKPSSATGDDAGSHGQVEHDPVHARFPLVQVYIVVVVVVENVWQGCSLSAR